MKKIAVAGLGYVGLANSLLLAQHHQVIAYDIDPHKIALLTQRQSPIHDVTINDFLQNPALHFRATLDKLEAFCDADYVIIATPTDYDAEANAFNTQSIETVAQEVMRVNSKALLIIKSTIPLGYTLKTRQMLNTDRLIFAPEFLREEQALQDSLHPSRIIVGERSQRGQEIAELFSQAAYKKDVPILLTDPNEAEAIKLFANAYLAMRISFFNELDTCAAVLGLDCHQMIQGVCLDSRIGVGYNNPSFGYGGYCLPKDSKQLLANCHHIPQKMISAIVEANAVRQDFITSEILKKRPKTVGIFRLLMKKNANNCRSSSIQGVMQNLSRQGITIVIYEPLLQVEQFSKFRVLHDLAKFKQEADIIVSNRMASDLSDVADKVYTRDLFGVD